MSDEIGSRDDAMNSELVPEISVSELADYVNQALDMAFGNLVVVGEVGKINHWRDRLVFFSLSDEDTTIDAMMPAGIFPAGIEEGMLVRVGCGARLTQKGKFSLSAKYIQPLGEGAQNRAFELLRQKLESEGLFNPDNKRQLPVEPSRVAVVSSSNAAGFKDFVKILGDRWGGMNVDLYDVIVQGPSAPDQIKRAIDRINKKFINYDVLVVVRGGGSQEDLSTFNDEVVVRAIAESRLPTLVGVGHEVDVSLAELVADKRASTPTHAAQILVPDRYDILAKLDGKLESLISTTEQIFDSTKDKLSDYVDDINQQALTSLEAYQERLSGFDNVIRQVDPAIVLRRGYAMVYNSDGLINDVAKIKVGQKLELRVVNGEIKAEVIGVNKR